jgi:hypothetical protein
MLKPNFNKHLEEDICIHIFTVSAAMVGVCLTVVGLLRVVITLQTQENIIDDLVSIDAVFFLVACLTSYWSLRTRNKVRMHRLENFADAVFILGMLFMVVICLYIPYAITLVKPV